MEAGARRGGEGAAFLAIVAVAGAVVFLSGGLDETIGFYRGRLTDWTGEIVPFWSLVWPGRDSPVSIPLWTPHVLCGYPFAADSQVQFLYPVVWLLFALPLEWASRPYAFVHLLAAAWGAYRYARLDVGRAPALLAAFVYALGGVLPRYLYGGAAMSVPFIAFLPWALLGARRIAAGAAGGVALTAVSLGLAYLGGHPVQPHLVALLAVGWSVASAPGRRLAVAVRASGAAVAGLALAAVAVVPTALEIVRSAPREAIAGSEFATWFSWEPIYWASLVAPYIAGDPVRIEFRAGSWFEWLVMTCHVGAVPFVLALVGLVRGRSPDVRRAAVCVVVGAVWSMGRYTPVFPFLLDLVPPLGLVRVPSRQLFLVAWGMALLAAHGLEAIGRRRWAALLVAVAALDVGRVAFRTFADSGPTPLPAPVALPDPHARAALGALQPNVALPLRLRSPDGYTPLAGGPYRRRVEAFTGGPVHDHVIVDPYDTAALEALAVRYVRAGAGAPPLGFRPAPVEGYWEYERAVPRARLEPAGRVTWVEDGADRLVLDVEVDGAGGDLRLVDAWHPDWRAWVDGREAAIEVWDGAFRSVEVPPGRHRVVMAFRPWPVAAGAAITVAAASGLAAAAVGAVRSGAWRGSSSPTASNRPRSTP